MRVCVVPASTERIIKTRELNKYIYVYVKSEFSGKVVLPDVISFSFFLFFCAVKAAQKKWIIQTRLIQINNRNDSPKRADRQHLSASSLIVLIKTIIRTKRKKTQHFLLLFLISDLV